MRTTVRACLVVIVAALVAAPSAGWSQATAQKPAPSPAKPGPSPAKPATPGTKPAPKPAAGPAQPSPGAGPVVVVETVKGTFEFETYPDEAPQTVEHVLRLVKRNFYNGLRVHRMVPNFVVQMGDPQTRDMTKREWWGRGDSAGSGRPVGVAEFSKKRLHVRGAVAMAHAGNAAQADAQFYVLLGDRPSLDGKYAVFGQVISGMDVVAKLQVTDVIKRVSIRP
jgi:peptidyl-prolyl cis-trans isomerase B (cyclophilin B)